MSCAKCHLPCGHPKDNWWSPGQIKFCWAQIMFLLANIGALKQNNWPEKKTGYIDTHEDVQVSVSDSVTHQEIIFVRSILEKRIAKLPQKYQDLIEDIDWEKMWWSLSPAARDIVNYLKNPEKVQDFSDWLKQIKYRGKIATKK